MYSIMIERAVGFYRNLSLKQKTMIVVFLSAILIAGIVGYNFASDNAEPMDESSLEIMIHKEINDARMSGNSNIEALDFSPHLRLVARKHSSEMNTYGYFNHSDIQGKNLTERYREYNYNCAAVKNDTNTVAGERIILFKYGEEFSTNYAENEEFSNLDQVAEGVVKNMEESGYIKQIRSEDWKSHGVGVEYNKQTNDLFITHNLC